MLRSLYSAVLKLKKILPERRIQVPVLTPVLQSELLKGRRAVITGGAKGIGFAIAEAFKSAGAEVVITGRDPARLDSALKTLMMPDKNGVQLDNTCVSDIPKAVERFGNFDILVNNAGFVCDAAFGETTEAEYDRTLDTNVKGAYFLSQEVVKRWIGKGVKGNILNVCSASSLRPGDSPYVLSKWGMRSLTLGMARRCVKYGIVVNGLAPGVTNTDKFLERSHGSLDHARNPAGRMVTVQEIANMAVVLVSDLARMIVGDVVYMTGGAGLITFD